ncbi:MAG: ASCH domain-containing protein [Anaerolineaceae bacterium]|nr:ASCH domain-containing protein [Anaerolineaceae bacterium]
MFLLFRKEFHEPIRSGRKRQTIRFWVRRHVRPGARMHSPHLGKFLVTDIQEIEPDQLTEDDARLDGFDSLAALREKLVELYGSIQPPDRRCFKLTFEFLGDG